MSGAGPVAGPRASPLCSSSSPRAVREVPASGTRKRLVSLCLPRGEDPADPVLPGQEEPLGRGGPGSSSVAGASPLVLRRAGARCRLPWPGEGLQDGAQGLPAQAGLSRRGSACISVCLQRSQRAGLGSPTPWGGLWGCGGDTSGLRGLGAAVCAVSSP